MISNILESFDRDEALLDKSVDQKASILRKLFST